MVLDEHIGNPVPVVNRLIFRRGRHYRSILCLPITPRAPPFHSPPLGSITAVDWTSRWLQPEQGLRHRRPGRLGIRPTPAAGGGHHDALTECRGARWRHREAGIRPSTLTLPSAREPGGWPGKPWLPMTSGSASSLREACRGHYWGNAGKSPILESCKSLRDKHLGWLGGRDSNSEASVSVSG